MLSRADIFLGHDDKAKAEAKRGLDLAGNLSRVRRMEIEASYYHAVADRAKAAEDYRVLFDLFPDSLDYGLQLAKLQLESYHPDEALETIRQLRRLPPPARDDPGLDFAKRESSFLTMRKQRNGCTPAPPRRPRRKERDWSMPGRKRPCVGRIGNICSPRQNAGKLTKSTLLPAIVLKRVPACSLWRKRIASRATVWKPSRFMNRLCARLKRRAVER